MAKPDGLPEVGPYKGIYVLLFLAAFNLRISSVTMKYWQVCENLHECYMLHLMC